MLASTSRPAHATRAAAAPPRSPLRTRLSSPIRRIPAPPPSATSPGPAFGPRDTVVPGPSFAVPLGLLAVLAGPPLLAHNPAGAALGAILPAFLALQATRVKFVFSPNDLEVVTTAGEAKTENAFVGGKNKWAYASFTNWEIFPSPALPILVYFKETQTKPEGQIHFFPVIFDFATLYAVMKARCGRSVNSA